MVWLASFPRSGQTKLAELWHCLTGLMPDTVYPARSPEFYHDANFVRTHHIAPEREKGKVVLVIRDPRDCLWSWWNLQKYEDGHTLCPFYWWLRKPLDRTNSATLAIETECHPDEAWYLHTSSWLRWADSLLIATYEGLLESPDLVLSSVANFVGAGRYSDSDVKRAVENHRPLSIGAPDAKYERMTTGAWRSFAGDFYDLPWLQSCVELWKSIKRRVGLCGNLSVNSLTNSA